MDYTLIPTDIEDLRKVVEEINTRLSILYKELYTASSPIQTLQYRGEKSYHPLNGNVSKKMRARFIEMGEVSSSDAINSSLYFNESGDLCFKDKDGSEFNITSLFP
jgi:hypothetical protein